MSGAAGEADREFVFNGDGAPEVLETDGGTVTHNVSVMDLMSLDRMLKSDEDGGIGVVCLLPQLGTNPP